MYWTPAKMQLFANIGEYSFANAANLKIRHNYNTTVDKEKSIENHDCQYIKYH